MLTDPRVAGHAKIIMGYSRNVKHGTSSWERRAVGPPLATKIAAEIAKIGGYFQVLTTRLRVHQGMPAERE